MRRLALVLLLLSVPTIARSQYWTEFDRDIKVIRDAVTPGLAPDHGNWVQYSPGAFMYALKALGMESRSEWGRMLVSQAIGTGLTMGVQGSLKQLVGRTGPDNSSSSFPSGNTATVFLTAGWLHTEFGWRYPWVDAVGYSLAACTAVQRILKNRDWATDTMAGALTGTLSCLAGYWLADRILEGRRGFWGKSSEWEEPAFGYDDTQRHYEVEYFYAARFSVFQNDLYPRHGGTMGVQALLPMESPGSGIAVRGSVTGYGREDYSRLDWFVGAGGYRQCLENLRFELCYYGLAGCGICSGHCGFATVAGASAAYILGYNSKLKLFGEYAITPFYGTDAYHSFSVGISAGLYF